MWKTTLATLFVLALCARGGAAAPDRIVVGGGDSFRPMMFVNEHGEPDGILVDVWRLWSEKTGVAVEFRLMDWSAVIPALKAGDIDVVEGVSYTSERARYLDFSKPHDEIQTYIFFHEDVYGVKDLHDIKGFPVGVLKGTNVQEYLEKNGQDLRLLLYENHEQIVNAALAGHLRVFVSEDPMVSYFFSKADSWGGFRRAQKPLLATDLRVGVRKGDTKLLSLVEQGMARITDKDRARIQEKWTGEPLAPRIPWKWLFAAAAALLGLIGAVVLWNTQLRRQVAAATRTLRQSQERFLQVAQNAHEWIWEVDAQGLFTYCSPAAETIMGYAPEELVGRRHYFDLFHAHDREEILARAVALFEEKAPFHGFVSRNTSKTGKDVWLSTTGVGIMDTQGVLTGFRGVNVDITEKRKTEQELAAHRERLEELVSERTEALEETHAQLLQAQKMEAIGVLSGGIAHDFNNILAAISGTAELMQRSTTLDQGLRRQVQRILNASRRARDLTMKLLTFARKEKLDVQTVAPNEIVADVADMLKTMPPRITLETRLAKNPPRVIVDRNQIGQALLNICINACDAIPGPGVVTIETYEKHCGENDGAPAPGAYCAMRVSDTGRGMDPDVQPKIFEPFFTTKERGKGTGLGLSVTLGIIQSHGGALNVTSAPGQGAAFEILLPIAEDLDPAAARAPEPAPEQQAAATLLVVDDDEDFLSTICEGLEMDGSKVLRASGGEQALELFANHNGSVDLVILDMLMPGMDGSAVFHALRAQDPALKILICSGYSVEGRATDLLNAGACGFIQKPFDFKDLIQTINDTLNP